MSFVLFTQCTGTELNTSELYKDDKLICNGLKCVFYHIFKKTLKQDDENSHICVCAMRCRIAMNVVGLVEIYGRSCSLFYWIYFTVQLKRTLES